MRKKIVALLVVVVVVFSGNLGCISEPTPVEEIAVAVTPWPGSAAVYVAQDKGYFTDEGLEAVLHSYISGHLGIEAVLKGQEDFATAGDTPIARAAIDGKPVAVIATISEINRGILIIARKDRGITTPDDLRAKRIGVVRGTTADFYLHIFLTTSYIDPEDVQIVSLETDKLVEALLTGEVDAVSTWSPHTIVLRDSLGDNAIVFHDPSIYTMTWNVAVTQEFAQDNPERIKKFLRAIIRANDFIREHPDEARAISAKHIGTDSALYDREWQDYRFTAVLDQSLVLNLEDQGRWMAEEEVGGASRPPNFVDFIYAEGLKAVQPEAVRIPGK